jgi:glucosamine-6-phosphate deaminase
MTAIIEAKFEKMVVAVYQNRATLGAAAAMYVRKLLISLQQEQAEIRMIFAAAASQREFFIELSNYNDIHWDKVIAFHMDEYHTLPKTAPQRFGNFLDAVIFRFKPFKKVHYMGDDMNAYASLIQAAPIDICCLGIGENGHLAFNDPPVADFNDPLVIKEVLLDETCRQQQVNDGEFLRIEDVPEKAITLTIPTLLKAKHLPVIVPGPTKANAVKNALMGEIKEACPASILRTKPNARLFLDVESSKYVFNDLNT